MLNNRRNSKLSCAMSLATEIESFSNGFPKPAPRLFAPLDRERSARKAASRESLDLAHNAAHGIPGGAVGSVWVAFNARPAQR